MVIKCTPTAGLLRHWSVWYGVGALPRESLALVVGDNSEILLVCFIMNGEPRYRWEQRDDRGRYVSVYQARQVSCYASPRYRRLLRHH